MTAKADVPLRRGTTDPDVSWLLKSQGQPFPGAGSTFVLVIAVRGKGVVIRKSTADGDGLTWEEGPARLRWRRTEAESWLIPAGRIARYQIERHIAGTERPIAEGYIVAEASLDDD